MYAGNGVSEFELRHYSLFYEMNTKCQKNNYKNFPVFYHKIKTRTYIKNLRHRSLHQGVINNW